MNYEMMLCKVFYETVNGYDILCLYFKHIQLERIKI